MMMECEVERKDKKIIALKKCQCLVKNCIKLKKKLMVQFQITLQLFTHSAHFVNILTKEIKNKM